MECGVAGSRSVAKNRSDELCVNEERAESVVDVVLSSDTE
jgi:hypothetical protein